MSDSVTIALLPDHPTPCRLRTHTAEPVPFVIYKSGVEPDGVTRYSESDVAGGRLWGAGRRAVYKRVLRKIKIEKSDAILQYE